MCRIAALDALSSRRRRAHLADPLCPQGCPRAFATFADLEEHCKTPHTPESGKRSAGQGGGKAGPGCASRDARLLPCLTLSPPNRQAPRRHRSRQRGLQAAAPVRPLACISAGAGAHAPHFPRPLHTKSCLRTHSNMLPTIAQRRAPGVLRPRTTPWTFRLRRTVAADSQPPSSGASRAASMPSTSRQLVLCVMYLPRVRTKKKKAHGSLHHCTPLPTPLFHCAARPLAAAAASCPCILKGVVCVACGCRNCKNKKPRKKAPSSGSASAGLLAVA